MSAPDGILNVKEPVTIGNTLSPGAVGDGCHDDSDRIQARLDLLAITNRQFDGNCSLPYYSALYFPAGIYRLTKPLDIPKVQGVRIFGDGMGDFPPIAGKDHGVGSVLKQDADGTAILRFREKGSERWSIERLGFRWTNQQAPPPGWDPSLPTWPVDDPRWNYYGDPGAVAILFTGKDPRETGRRGYFHGRISECFFRGGWRGIAIDDAFPYYELTTNDNGDFAISPWNIQIDQCRFYYFSGAAISLYQRQGQWTGKPNNAVLNTYVDNVKRSTGLNVPNLEPQLRFSTSSSLRLAGVDLEGSRTTVIHATQSVMTITNMHIEHVDVGPIAGGFPRLFDFGGGTYAIHGMTLDGAVNAEDLDNPLDKTKSHIIYAGQNTEVVVSGLRAYPLPPATTNLDEGVGFIPINGDAQLFALNADNINTYNTRLHLLDRPVLPVYEASERQTWNTNNAPNTYDEFLTYPEAYTRTVRPALLKAKASVTIPTLASGATGSVTFTVEGARPGDIVQMGLPPLGVGCMATALVAQDDLVEIRFYNCASSSMPSTSEIVTVVVGGGPNAGFAQVTTDLASLDPGYPPHEVPDA